MLGLVPIELVGTIRVPITVGRQNWTINGAVNPVPALVIGVAVEGILGYQAVIQISLL